MTTRAKRLPRLWCALQGLLPLEACLAAQRGELAWPHEPAAEIAPVTTGAPAGTVPEKELPLRSRRTARRRVV